MDHRSNAVRIAGAVAALLFVSACSDRTSSPVAPSPDQSASFSSAVTQTEVLSNAVIHRTLQGQAQAHAAGHGRPGGGNNNLTYHGGVGGIGVETAPRVYVVFWGSQWSNDPSGEADLVQSFLRGVGGSSWLKSVTQYCQAVASGTIFCNGAGQQAAGDQSGIFADTRVWADNSSPAPSKPTQSQLAAEAVRAASHFGNTAAGSNASAQYVIATATGNSSSGFGTQYCAYHSSTSSSAGNQQGIFVNFWFDNGTAAPSRPSQSQLAAEAVSAAANFGNTTSSSNASAQYVIATAHGNNSSGFGSQYCAYHSSTSSSAGNIAYTNLPYITDAGASCGANFNGLGPNAGITIVEGHELAETITDQFPNGGWLDGSGAENGDKCAWISSGQGASANTTLSTGTFPVQSLWSNAFNSGAGGCVLSF